MLDQQKEIFKEEAHELLTELESALLELEENPDDIELVAKVFRAMHTIKGSGAMFGFDDIAGFTHEVETVFDLVRTGELPVTRELINHSLAARDHIRSLLDLAAGGAVDVVRGAELVTAFRGLAAGREQDGAAPTIKAAIKTSVGVGSDITYRIRLRLAENIMFNGTRPESLLRELAELGSCRAVAQTDRIPLLDQLSPENCHVYWDVILTTDKGLNAIMDIFIFVEDDIELKIDIIDDGDYLDADPNYKRIGEILLDRGDITKEELAAFLAAGKVAGEKLIDATRVPQGKIEAALQEQAAVRAARSQRQSQESVNSVRVPSDRLDSLVNLVGELVTAQARLTQAATVRNDPELTEIAEEVERLTTELRDNSLNLRMLPIGTTFNKFKRLVRDLTNELGKNVELKTIGADTEIDKNVIEKLNDPLIHLIRNSLDHGIETPQLRKQAGKPAVGTILLSAAHSGDSVEIVIQDDGKGLDREAILAKGVEKGLIHAEQQPGDSEIFNLIFTAGFSTAATVTGISGRGVGMDVVRQAIDALRGTINIASTPGVGSTITIRIPLTLAIIESLLVGIEADTYAMPLSIVEECVELSRDDIARAHGRHLVNVRDQLVPYIPLRQEFQITEAAPELQQVVITNLNGNRVGFVVDLVIGQHQSVIKSLGRMCRDVRGISGATILGDGRVALILDINHLTKKAEQDARL